MANLLPPGSTQLERATAEACATTLPAELPQLWDAATCPSALLPWLAWGLHVEGWELAESDDARRALIANAIALHKLKGTPESIRALIRSLGFGEVEIIEGLAGRVRDGSIRRDALYVHGDPSAWAKYRVLMQRPITNDQAALLRSMLKSYAPARCHLASLEYQAVANRHNGAILRNGQYNRGTA